MNSFSTDPLNTEDNTDWLESLLHESHMETIADDGFSAQVMQWLPEKTTSKSQGPETQQSSRFEWFSLIGAISGSAIAVLSSDWPNPDQIAGTIAALIELKPVSIDTLLPWLASIFSAAVLAVVMDKTYQE